MPPRTMTQHEDLLAASIKRMILANIDETEPLINLNRVAIVAAQVISEADESFDRAAFMAATQPTIDDPEVHAAPRRKRRRLRWS